MEQQHHQQRKITVKSRLSPDQLRVLSLYHSCGIKLDSVTFLSLWKLASLGIPANIINDLLRDISRQQ